MPAATIELCYRRLGKNIRARRVGIRLSKDELARRVGMSRATVYRVERGGTRLPLHHVAAFARVLKVPAKQLLDGVL
jgi:transcriptional regulator with XRE-family HTH domain